MEELNLLEHSTYNVEQIEQNKAFFKSLMNKIISTYRLCKYNEYVNQNVKKVSFAPSQGRIDNVFISMNLNGEIDFVFNVTIKDSIIETIREHCKISKYTHHTELKINGVNAENYQKHLPYIVKAIEFADYSFL